MKVWHRGHLPVEARHFLEAAQIKHWALFEAPGSTAVRKYMFVIEEDHPYWKATLARLKGDRTYISTEFTGKEIAEAEWSMGHARHCIKSVRPGDYGWSTDFFEGQCSHCGSGWRQIAPFRIKKEPKLGKKVFADFGSAFELFCAPVVLEAFKEHRMRGFETQPLILNKADCPAEGLKQLIVTEVAQPAIAEDLVEHQRYSQTDCLICGKTWHAHYTRGTLPLRRSALNPNVDFQLTNEWLGNGRTARREILFSRRVVNLALENKWQGIEFIPVRVV
jgi:hypothetical protein